MFYLDERGKSKREGVKVGTLVQLVRLVWQLRQNASKEPDTNTGIPIIHHLQHQTTMRGEAGAEWGPERVSWASSQRTASSPKMGDTDGSERMRPNTISRVVFTILNTRSRGMA